MKVVKRKEKIKNVFYKVLDVLPNPPVQFNLNTSQKYWWYWVGNILIDTNQFAQLDLIYLQSAAYWLDVRCRMIAIQNHKNKGASTGTATGNIQTFNSGAQQVSVYEILIEKADKALLKLSLHFGLSIYDRNKLTSPPEVDPDQIIEFKDIID